MSILSSRPSSEVKYDEGLKHVFYRAAQKQVKRKIYDDDGNVVREDFLSVPFQEEIPVEELEHRGVSCDMFTIENMQAAGVELSPITKPLFGITIDQRSLITEQVENFDYDSLTEKDFENQK